MRDSWKLLWVTILLFAVHTWAAVAADASLFVRWRDEGGRALFYARLGVIPTWRSEIVSGLERVRVQAGSEERVLAALRAVPGLIYAERNESLRRSLDLNFNFVADRSPTASVPNDPHYSEQWALKGAQGLRIPGAWRYTQGAPEVRVAVLDTGVDMEHPELRGRFGPSYDFVTNSSEIVDPHGHGTHVAGAIGARVDNAEGIAGIAPEVTLMSLRVIPTEDDETDADLIEAIEFAVQKGARVANCSFGKERSSQAVAEVIQAAGEQGLLVVVAAGNQGVDLRQQHFYPASFNTPNMVVVAASDNAGKKADFSNFGPGIVDVAAPGVGILSTLPGGRYAAWDGTSMAAPQVSGVAALMAALGPGLSPYDLKQILISSSRSFGAWADHVDAAGLINATEALRQTARAAR
jgi:thermitase